MIANRLIETRDLKGVDRQAHRSLGLGSSDAASALGYDPYRSPADTFDEKVGLSTNDVAGEAAEWGTLLEDDVIAGYEARTGNRCENIHAVLQHPDHPFMLAQVDRRVVGAKPRKLVEAKTQGLFAHMHGDWGAPEIEPDRVPTKFLCQTQHQLAVTGYELVDLPLLVGGQKMYLYRDIKRNETFIASMIALEAKFWKNVEAARRVLSAVAIGEGLNYDEMLQAYREHVLDDAIARIIDQEIAPYRPLPVSYSEASQRWEAQPERKIQANTEATALFERLVDLQAQEKALKAQLDATKTALGNYLQDCTELLIDGKTALTWRTQERKGFYVEPSTSRPMRVVKKVK